MLSMLYKCSHQYTSGTGEIFDNVVGLLSQCYTIIILSRRVSSKRRQLFSLLNQNLVNICRKLICSFWAERNNVRPNCLVWSAPIVLSSIINLAAYLLTVASSDSQDNKTVRISQSHFRPRHKSKSSSGLGVVRWCRTVWSFTNGARYLVTALNDLRRCLIFVSVIYFGKSVTAFQFMERDICLKHSCIMSAHTPTNMDYADIE